MSTDNEIPQWKKELIARLRSQNRRTAGPPRRAPVQRVASEPPVESAERCEVAASSAGVKMVQERSRENGSPDSDSSEELRYGPGIVNRLKNKYLSLAQRETVPRPTVLLVRKAASLENILDGEDVAQERPCAKAAAPERHAARSDLKRAHSVETISAPEHEEVVETRHGGGRAVNRPKRIAPVVSEREKPPADVVKQAKLIFERRPEQRTRAPHQTGDVAAKVATYKSIMVQAKAAKKPPVKLKPSNLGDAKAKTNGVRTTKLKAAQVEKAAVEEAKEDAFNDRKKQISESKSLPSLPSPIPDISRIEVKTSGDENGTKPTSLSETPDLIMTSSPLSALNSPSFRISATENFIREEIRVSSLIPPPSSDRPAPGNEPPEKREGEEESGVKRLGDRGLNLNNGTNTMTFNFAKSSNSNNSNTNGNSNRCPNHLPVINRNVSNARTSPLQPLRLEINGVNGGDELLAAKRGPSPEGRGPTRAKPALTVLEMEKNLINAAKTLEQQPKNNAVVGVVVSSNSNSSNSIRSADEVTNKIKVPKVRKPPPVREPENNSIVFKFTDRKDVPDYVHNDGVRKVAKVEKPKVGEGGIILLPGASIDESFTDEDEEIMRSLEGPPSPCDVTFINDNVLIDGKSSLSQKTKKAKMKISFVEAGPEIYEYPSESSLLVEDVPTSPMTAQIRHPVPSLSGSSSLGNYTPKSTEEFHPGVTRSVQNIPTKIDNIESTDSTNELIFQEVEQPILFSAGANSDILF